MTIGRLVAFVRAWRAKDPAASKADLVAAVTPAFSLRPDGALLVCDSFVVRISSSTSSAFSNTVVAIKKIVEFDRRPVIACLITPREIRMLMANSSFIRKVSHSSHGLDSTKLVGSILGTDIVDTHEGLANAPEHFDALWRLHTTADREANLARIIAATRSIVGGARVWTPSADERANVLAAPGLAERVSQSAQYKSAAADLDRRVQAQREPILEAATDSNSKTRGDAIERIVTGSAKSQALGDLTIIVAGTTIDVDVKSKRLDLTSAPKAYNVDKFLREIARGNRLLAMLFIGVDLKARTLRTRLISVLDQTLLAATRIDKSWSGRGTRGHAQFSGDLRRVLEPSFRETIDIAQASTFLNALIESDGS
jgi:hypothetical protein